MTNTNDPATLPVSPELLAILRDPYAIQNREQYGDDPGQLELVHGSWLVSADTGYKYPIRDGIPVMLIEEGARWKDTPIDQLPVPPPGAEPALPLVTEDKLIETDDKRFRYGVFLAAGAALMGAAAVGLARLRRKAKDDTGELPPAE